MPYVQKTTRAGNCIYVQRHYTSRYGSKYKCTRSTNYGKTPEAMAVVNSRNACLKQEMIFNANFVEGDWTATFTFRKKHRPKDLKALKALWKPYFDKIRYAYKKAGIEFKWMRCFETPENNPHIHVALSYIDWKRMPKWKYGGLDLKPVDDRDHHTYGGYLREETHVKMQHEGKYAQCKDRVCFSHSRNLIIPEPEYEVIYHDHWSDEPKAQKGYYVVKNTVNNWNDEVTGFKYQSFVMCPLPTKNVRLLN